MGRPTGYRIAPPCGDEKIDDKNKGRRFYSAAAENCDPFICHRQRGHNLPNELRSSAS